MNSMVSERERCVRSFVEVEPGFRRRVEDTIERLLLLLDSLDGDADEEDDSCGEPDFDDEPSLSATVCIDQRHSWSAIRGEIDGEIDRTTHNARA